jgi:hypothetical protein
MMMVDFRRSVGHVRHGLFEVEGETAIVIIIIIIVFVKAYQ